MPGGGTVSPATTRTRPSARRVAVWLSRAVLSEPVGAHVPVPGSKRSAFTVAGPPVVPPATRTEPSPSRVAVWTSRALLSDPVAVQRPTVAPAETGNAETPRRVAPTKGRARARKRRRAGGAAMKNGTAGVLTSERKPGAWGRMEGSPDDPGIPA